MIAAALTHNGTGMGSTVLATDVLWSDPVREPGLRTNAVRGVGLVFGPDITEVPFFILTPQEITTEHP